VRSPPTAASIALDKPDQIWSFISVKTYTISESKAQLSALVEAVVSRGEEVVIGRAGKPMVRLVPYRAAKPGKRLGAFSGRIEIADDFDVWDGPEADAFGIES